MVNYILIENINTNNEITSLGTLRLAKLFCGGGCDTGEACGGDGACGRVFVGGEAACGCIAAGGDGGLYDWFATAAWADAASLSTASGAGRGAATGEAAGSIDGGDDCRGGGDGWMGESSFMPCSMNGAFVAMPAKRVGRKLLPQPMLASPLLTSPYTMLLSNSGPPLSP